MEKKWDTHTHVWKWGKLKRRELSVPKKKKKIHIMNYQELEKEEENKIHEILPSTYQIIENSYI